MSRTVPHHLHPAFALLVAVLLGTPAQASTDPAPQAPPLALGPLVLHAGGDDDLGPHAVGANFEARFGHAGTELSLVAGGRAPVRQNLTISAVRLERGSSQLDLNQGAARWEAGSAVFARGPGIEEHFTPHDPGLMHGVWIGQPFGEKGDLIVHFALGGSLAPHGQARGDGGHRFDAGFGALDYGTLVALDALGYSITGEVQVGASSMTWRIPADFVDRAQWPLWLDPLIGSEEAFEAGNVGEIDIAYDATSGNYLAVFERIFAQNDKRVRAQRLNSSGFPLGGVIALNELTTTRGPRVASVRGTGRFAAAWVQDFFGESQVRLRAVDATTGALSTTIFIVGEPEGSIGSCDIAGESTAGFSNQAWVVWDSSNQGIRGARVAVATAGNPTVSSAFGIVGAPPALEAVRRPSLSASPSGAGRLAVVWTRTSFFTGSSRILGATFDRSGNVVQTATQVSPSGVSADRASIDGGGGLSNQVYTVAWSERLGETSHRGRLRRWSPGSAQPLGDVELLGSSSEQVLTAVAWKDDKVLVAWRSAESVPGTIGGTGLPCTATVTRHWLGVRNANTCQVCPEEALVLAFVNTSLCAGSSAWLGHLGLALRAGAGETTSSFGLLVGAAGNSAFSFFGVYTQAVSIDSPLAKSTSLGGACGGVGDILALSPPAIGNTNFRLALSGAGSSALLAILNLAAPGTPLECGPCRWMPFQITSVHTPVLGAVIANVPIPCSPALVGGEIHAQFTVLRPGALGCAPFPDLGVTSILSLELY